MPQKNWPPEKARRPVDDARTLARRATDTSVSELTLTFGLSVEPMPAWENWKLERLGWPPGTLVWLLQADGGDIGPSWANYRFEISAARALAATCDRIYARIAELGEEWMLVPLAGRVLHAGIVATLQTEWFQGKRATPLNFWAPTIDQADALSVADVATLWRGGQILRASLEQRGRPRLETTQDRWRPLAEQAEQLKQAHPALNYKHIAARLGVSERQLEGWRHKLADLRKRGI